MKMALENEPIKKFNVTPTSKFDRELPIFKELGEVGFYSKEKGKFHADKRQLKHVILPSKTDLKKFDLRKGYKEWIRYDDTPQKIDDLLRWIMHKPQVFQLHSETELSSLNTDFVCRRGLFKKLACTPYENQGDWKIAVIRFKDTFFLCEFMTENSKKQVAKTKKRQDEMGYWGYKFEQYMTSAEKDRDKPININEVFYSIVRPILGDHSLVYGGEIDGIDDSIEGNNKYVEFKTSRIKDSNFNFQSLPGYKLINFWAQSHLVGISKIICGFRDDYGVVHQIKEFQTEEIPDNLQDLKNPWKPNVCMNFLNDILKFIKHSIETSDSKTVYLLEWSPPSPLSPGSDVTLKKTADPQYNFLPDWFITWDGWKSEEST